MLRLNDYNVPVSKQKVSIGTQFATQDISGETSASDTAHKGIKAKELSVSFTVDRDDADVVSEFYRTAEATDDNGDLVVYKITNDTANSANIRQVKFTGRIDQREADELQEWIFSIKLKEHLSVPEKNEKRQDVVTAEPSASEGEAVAADSTPPDTETPENLTGFEGVLKSLDQALA